MKFGAEESLKNDQRLLSLLDSHRGKRCFVVGNGPSLKIDDLDKLTGEITFASNRIFLAFEETQWRPTYYTMCDAVVGRDNLEEVRALDLTKTLAGSVREFYRADPQAVFVNFPRSQDEKDTCVDKQGIVRMKGVEPPREPLLLKAVRLLGRAPKLSRNPTMEELRNDISWPLSWNLLRGARAGHSVINLGLKLAYWMGIREVYVIGCDHSFAVPETKTGEIVYRNEVVVSEGEVNHFHPDYRKPGEKWTTPKLDVMAEEFRYARTVFEADGGHIWNASRFSKLEAWDRVEFDGLF